MQLYFMKKEALDYFKVNMNRLYTYYFQRNDNSWMTEEFGDNPFVPFLDVPEFELASLIDGQSAGEIDLLNCKIVYEKLMNLSESQASDERLWAGLCNSTFYQYMRNRHGYNTVGLKDKKSDISGILSRFYFSGGIRAGLYRNTLAKCWWVGRAAYDKSNQINHFELLDSLGANDFSTKVSDIFYSNTFASNPVILKGICDALRSYRDHGIKLKMKEEIRPAVRYLNAVGGATLLDVMTSDEIKIIVQTRISEIIKGESIDFLNVDDDSEDIDEVIVETAYSAEETGTVDNDSEPTEETDYSQLVDIEVEQTSDDLFGPPEYVMRGCYITVMKDQKEINYSIPKEGDNSRDLLMIEKKMLGKQVGHRLYLSGAWYELVDFGWNEEKTSTE